MTAADMITNFGLRYAMEINDSVPGWENDEIYSFLNKAQRKIVEELYIQRNFELLRNLFYRNWYTGADLKDYSAATGIIENAYYIELDVFAYPYLYYIQSWSKVTRTEPTMTNTVIKNDNINLDSADKFAESPANKPFFIKPVAFFDKVGATKEALVVVFDYYTTALTEVILEYVREPEDIAVAQNCELDDSLHDGVVDKAVMYALETLESPRIQTQPVINQGGANVVNVDVLRDRGNS